jgi:hypothetical protein
MSSVKYNEKKKELDRISATFSKQSYYCPYCKGTNTVGAQNQRKLLNEGKKLICYHCHRGFSIVGLKTVYEHAQIRFFENQYKKFLAKRNKNN